MAKVYIITEEEMKALVLRIETVKLKHVGEGGEKAPGNTPVGELYSALHFQIFSWISEVSR